MIDYIISREEKLIIWSLSVLLLLEFAVLLLMAYFSRFEAFVTLFVAVVRLISPLFIVFNLGFLIFNVFTRGIALTIESWEEYVGESLRFFIISFVITVALITISACFGALIGISLKSVYYQSTYREIMNELRRRVAESFY